MAIATEGRPITFPSIEAATIEAFGQYIAKIEAQNAASLRQGPSLWVDGLSRERTKRNDCKIEKRRSGDAPAECELCRRERKRAWRNDP